MFKRFKKHSHYLYQLGASIIIGFLIWGIGVLGLQLVTIEGNAITSSGIHRIFLLMAAPFFLGMMSYFLVKWSKGYKGPPDLMKVLREKSSEFPGWLRAIITWIIACIELGSGLSPKGFEGPYIAAAGGFSGWLSTKLHLDHDARRRLARCGLGVAFGVLFRTPLGGFVCTFEFGESERKEFTKQLPLAILSTITSYSLTTITKLPKPFINISLPKDFGMHELLILILVGIACGITALLYVFLIRYSKDIFGKLEKKLPLILIPVIGATVSTVLGGFFPIILGSNELSRVLTESPAIPILLIGAIFAKIIATASADGSKCAGGTVGPAILLGGLVGTLVGGANPLFAAAGSASVIGPIAGLPITMIITAATWLGFAPLALLIVIPIVISKVICRNIELYPAQSAKLNIFQDLFLVKTA